MGRKSGAMHVEMRGVDETQIRRLGRWNTESLENSYLSFIPKQAVHVMAGFSVNDLYRVHRSLVEPSTALLDQVFPDLNDLLNPASNNTVESFCTIFFFKFLQWLRIVILQDSALLIHQFGSSFYLSDHPLFQTPEFCAFKEQVVAAEEAAIDDSLLDPLNTVVPVISDKLSAVHQQVSVLTSAVMRFENLFERQALTHNGATNQQYSALASSVKASMSRIENLIEGMHIETRTVSTIRLPQDRNQEEQTSGISTHGTVICTPVLTETIHAENSSPVNTAEISECISNRQDRPDNLSSTGLEITHLSQRPLPITYTLPRGLGTASDIANAWHNGVDGNPPIKDLLDDRLYVWKRTDAAERQQLCRIRSVIAAVDQVAAGLGVSWRSAATAVDELLSRKKKSLKFLKSKPNIAGIVEECNAGNHSYCLQYCVN
jgi:Centromere DNA-binding protein complex CBF3 subunit, domain 2